MLTVPPLTTPSGGTAGPFESSAVPMVIFAGAKSSVRLVFDAVGAELPTGPPEFPLEHAAVSARDPIARTARADRVRADISLLVVEM
jgi:hypothetical protein